MKNVTLSILLLLGSGAVLVPTFASASSQSLRLEASGHMREGRRYVDGRWMTDDVIYAFRQTALSCKKFDYSQRQLIKK